MSSNDPPSKPDEGKAAPAAKRKTKSIDGHLHTIRIEDLIVHRYSEHEALFKKAEKVTREIIESELRDGEGMRPLGRGAFQVFLPKLTPEAGSLRCSVIAERVAREIRGFNPTSQTLESEKESRPQAPSGPRRIPSAASEGVDAGGHHIAGTRALAMMAEAASIEEIRLSEKERETLATLKMSFHPVWYTKNNLITGYYCQLNHDGRRIGPADIRDLLEQSSIDVAAAKLDATLYRHAAEAVQYLLKEGLKALLIVPVHFSTVDRLRFMSSLLEAGGTLPEAARELLVFELIDLPHDLSRFRMREPVGYLRPRSRAMIARTGFELADLEMFKELGFHGVSVDVGSYDWKEARLLKGFERFVEDTESDRLQSFVHGISSKSLAVAAVAAGFRYMDGEAISESVDHPKRIRPYEIDMLYEA